MAVAGWVVAPSDCEVWAAVEVVSVFDSAFDVLEAELELEVLVALEEEDDEELVEEELDVDV